MINQPIRPMKNILNPLMPFFVLIALGTSCESPTTADAGHDPEEVMRIIEQKNGMVTEALKNGDIEAASAHFADNVIQLPPNMPPVRGIDAYKEHWSTLASFGHWTLDLDVVEVKVAEDMAMELGKYNMSFTPNETSPIPEMEDTGNYVVLWEYIDNDWKIVWDAPVSTVPMPMPPADSTITTE